MNHLHKKDYIYILITIVSFLLLVFLITNNTFLYASSTNIEYINYIEQIRNLVFETNQLLPELPFTISTNLNIFNYIECTIFNPLLLPTYLLPLIEIDSYIIFISVLIPIISTILMYIFLSKHKYNSEICFLSSLLFILSTSITYNSHSNIKLILIIPFIILNLLGVDKVFKDNKSYILTISIFLSIMVNPSYSLSGILCTIVYATYRYLGKMNKPTLKTFGKKTLQIVGPIILALLSTSCIIIPIVLLSTSTNQEIIVNLKNLLLPSINTNNILYSPESIGLTSIILISIINIFKKNKGRIFLGITLTVLIIFNIFNYTLSNVLISFLPLYILTISEYIKDLFNNKNTTNIKQFLVLIIITVLILSFGYRTNRFTLDILVLLVSILLYFYTSKKLTFIIPIVLFTIINTYTINIDNALPLKSTYYEEKITKKELIENIKLIDNTNYRIDTTDKNIIDIILNNNKYTITTNKPNQGTILLTSQNGIFIYKNENTLPLGFATSNILSNEDYELLESQTKKEALLNNIVADVPSNNKFIPTTEKINLDYKEIFKASNIKIDKNNNIKFTTNNTLKVTYKLPKKYRNKIIIINFNVNNNKVNNRIKINNIIKELSISNTYQKEENLEFILSKKAQDKIIMIFEPGTYHLSDFETYVLDYANLESSIKKYDKLKNTTIDKNEITGVINVIKDGYFMFELPYNKNYKIKVNNEFVKYERVNENYIGFKIEQGTHDIYLNYTSKGRIIGTILSILGIITFIVVTYLESKRKF